MNTTNPNTFAPESRNLLGINGFKLSKGNKVTVIGAGAFGGWSSLYLLRKGFDVTLVDAWGAGNSRSSSGDETRVIRSTYGANEFYFDLNVRALSLWKENQERWNKQLFFNVGVLWFCYERDTPQLDDSIPFTKKHKQEYEYLSPDELSKRFPAVHTGDLHHAYLDPFGGYLKARESMQQVHNAFLSEGGNYIQAYVRPGSTESDRMSFIELSNGEQIKSDLFLFACGSWLGKLFPEVLGDVITCTKQEVYYFGTPKHESELYDKLPAWIDVDGKDFYYGIPGNQQRGFKIGVDKRGEIFDPTDGDRIANPNVLSNAKKFIEHRFPGLRGAPLVENRVCPYENSPDGNFIFQSHPEAANVWFLGGGSGHGFKHGPALGELVANSFS